MLSFRLRFKASLPQNLSKILKLFATRSNILETNSNESEQFRVLDLYPQTKVMQEKRKTRKTSIPPSRATNMPTDQDWPSVWPGARTFHPASVPLPLRQGYQEKGASPNKYANAELMKIPNFLHLTPPAIQRHCEALKQFCTKWPTVLENEEICSKHFPIEIISSDYCYSSPTIRDPLARIVNLQVKLSSLYLDTHAKDKLLRLLGNKYNPETDIITITADRCPLRKQNLEYAWYLLMAVYHESWRVESWEAEKSIADMEYFDWDTSQSRTSLVTLYTWPIPPTDYDYEIIPHATEYKIAVSDLINNGEDQYSVNKYKEAVKNLLNLKCDNKE
ncbi:28S ribosomal protein S35, mitochondrial [Camponotus floridanus]|uniref:28S ribosomal protein S35, mitochondrial n=1 Tax=Camponotus floridanus TaxID=104421 RepID=E2A1Y3_CAMFO|nr:28S ribosomal protein S35, mitochondrial [Camponotus floridanus]EFN72559.1 28S ribosomal protein S35, mitochondrial [Camponotus floridanus]